MRKNDLSLDFFCQKISIKKIFQKTLSFLKSSNSTKGGIVFLGMSLVASALNYVFQLIGRRVLPNEEFGAFGSFMSIFNLVSASLLSAFQISVAVHIAKNTNEKNKIDKFLQGSIIFGFFLLFTTSFLGIFYKSLGFSSPLIFLNLGISIFFGSIGSALNGGLQGRKKFSVLGFASVFVSITKIITFLIFAYFVSKNVLMASVSQSIASIFIILPGVWFFVFNKKIPKDEKINLKEIFSWQETKKSFLIVLKFFKESLDKFVGVTLFTAFYSIDLILINALKSDNFSSNYATLSLFVKILLFPIVAINGIFLPYIAESSKNYSALKRVSKIFFALVFLITSSVLIFYIGAPHLVFKVLLLEKFSYLEKELIAISVFGFFLAISSSFFYFFNGVKEKLSNFVIAIGTIVEIFIIIFARSAHSLAQQVWISSFVVFLGFSILFLKKIFELKKKEEKSL
ncbi:MAG: hypothetical protein Fur0024_4300 [Patescibacteria group bacterium]